MPKTLLRTTICDILGIEYPVLLAGMGPTAGGGRGSAATAPLVAAVSNAGGLGVLGGAGFNPDALREEIREIRGMTEKPFGVDLLFPSNTVRIEPQQDGQGVADWRSQIPEEYWEAIRELRAQFGIPDVRQERPAGARGWRLEDQVEVVLEERVPVLAS